MTTPQPLNFLITGAARGIGRGLTRHLLQSHHRVLLLDNNAPELTHTASQLSTTHKQGRDFDAVLTDLRSPAAILEAADKARTFFDGRLDCLVNNAAYTGGVGAAPLAELEMEVWQASLETNLTAPMLMTRACLPLLRKTDGRRAGGSVIHISSTRAFMSEPNNEAYATTKAGLLGLSQSLATSLAADGVRSNVVLPGWIHVEDECQAADEAGRKWEEGLGEEDQRWHLTGRVGRVEDVVRAVEYLAGAEGVTGGEVVVDGGVTRKMVYPE